METENISDELLNMNNILDEMKGTLKFSSNISHDINKNIEYLTNEFRELNKTLIQIRDIMKNNI